MKVLHLVYAIVALAGVAAMALSGSPGLMAQTADAPVVRACDPDHLERPCEYAARTTDVLADGQVIAR